MTTEQRGIYKRVKEELRIEFEKGGLTIWNAAVKLGKLAQITSGFLILENGEVEEFATLKDEELLHLVNDEIGGKIVIWCRFRHSIKKLLKMLGETATGLHGDVLDYQAVIDSFQGGDKRFLVAQLQVSAGYTVAASHVAIFYECDFSLANREQAEGRQHRIGQRAESVVYIDLVCAGTVDRYHLQVIRGKQELSSAIMEVLK